jgi:hypothetical protein
MHLFDTKIESAGSIERGDLWQGFFVHLVV